MNSYTSDRLIHTIDGWLIQKSKPCLNQKHQFEPSANSADVMPISRWSDTCHRIFELFLFFKFFCTLPRYLDRDMAFKCSSERPGWLWTSWTNLKYEVQAGGPCPTCQFLTLVDFSLFLYPLVDCFVSLVPKYYLSREKCRMSWRSLIILNSRIPASIGTPPTQPRSQSSSVRSALLTADHIILWSWHHQSTQTAHPPPIDQRQPAPARSAFE